MRTRLRTGNGLQNLYHYRPARRPGRYPRRVTPITAGYYQIDVVRGGNRRHHEVVVSFVDPVGPGTARPVGTAPQRTHRDTGLPEDLLLDVLFAESLSSDLLGMFWDQRP